MNDDVAAAGSHIVFIVRDDERHADMLFQTSDETWEAYNEWGGDSLYPADWLGTRSLKAAGAKHVIVLHTIDKKLADTDSFAAVIAKAGC